MTRNELYELLKKCGWETTPIHTLDKIWGRPFDGETEKIRQVSEESSATLSKSFPDGTTYTRSYQVHLPPQPIQQQ